MTRIGFTRDEGLHAHDPAGTRLGACDGPPQDMWETGEHCAFCRDRTPKYWAVHVSGTLTQETNPVPGSECVCKGSAFYLPETYVVEQRPEQFRECQYNCVPCPIHAIDEPPDHLNGFNRYWGGMDGVLLDRVEWDLSLALVRLYKGDAIGAFRIMDPNWSSYRFDCRNSGWEVPWLMNEAGQCDWSGINVRVETHVGRHPDYGCTWCGCRDRESEPEFWEILFGAAPVDDSCRTCDESQLRQMLYACRNAARYNLPTTWAEVCESEFDNGCVTDPHPNCLYRQFGIVDFRRGGCQFQLSSTLYSGWGGSDDFPDPVPWELANETYDVDPDFSCGQILHSGTTSQFTPGPSPYAMGCDWSNIAYSVGAITGAAAQSRGLYLPRRSIVRGADIPGGCDNCGYDARNDPDFPQDLL